MNSRGTWQHLGLKKERESGAMCSQRGMDSGAYAGKKGMENEVILH